MLCLGTTRKDEEMFGRLAKMLKENSEFEVKYKVWVDVNMEIESAMLYMYCGQETIECKVLC